MGGRSRGIATAVSLLGFTQNQTRRQEGEHGVPQPERALRPCPLSWGVPFSPGELLSGWTHLRPSARKMILLSSTAEAKICRICSKRRQRSRELKSTCSRWESRGRVREMNCRGLGEKRRPHRTETAQGPGCWASTGLHSGLPTHVRLIPPLPCWKPIHDFLPFPRAQGHADLSPAWPTGRTRPSSAFLLPEGLHRSGLPWVTLLVSPSLCLRAPPIRCVFPIMSSGSISSLASLSRLFQL